MTVSLNDKAVEGADVVQIAFDVGDMQCQDGGEVDLTDVEPGTSVSFRRVGDGVDAMSPPIIAAQDVVINCA
jgi:hypothetical protein